MRGLIVVAIVTLSAPAYASESMAEVPEETPPAPAEGAPAVEVMPAAAEAAQPAVADADAGEAPGEQDGAPASRRPRLRWVELAVDLAQARHPGRPADLFAPMPPPLVVADGFGLLVQRRFGR